MIELAKCKTAVEVASKADLLPVLELLMPTAQDGEMDVQFAAASEKLRDDFGK